MANKLYPKAAKGLMSGAFNLPTDTLKVVLVDLADYTYSDAHQFLSDIPAAGRVATAAVTGATVSDLGVFDAADSTFSAATGDTSEALVIYKDTGTATTSALLLFLDVVTGLPVTPNGGDIAVTWNASGILQITS